MNFSTGVLLVLMACANNAAGSSVSRPVPRLPDALGLYSRSAVYLKFDLKTLLEIPHTHAAAVVVASGSAAKPHRRGEDQPILTFAPSAAAVIPLAVQQALTAALQQVEELRGVRLYPLSVEALPHEAFKQQGSAPPWAVFDASAGRVLLRSELLAVLGSTPAQAVAVLANACTAAVGRLLQLVIQTPHVPTLHSLLDLISNSMAAGVAAAFTAAAAVSGPPKWFCFVCPIVLGLLAPLIINAGVGEAADMACKEMKLTDEECVDLWFTALALGMILSLLAAIPIYKVCRLYECAHPGAAGRPVTGTIAAV